MRNPLPQGNRQKCLRGWGGAEIALRGRSPYTVRAYHITKHRSLFLGRNLFVCFFFFPPIKSVKGEIKKREKAEGESKQLSALPLPGNGLVVHLFKYE